MRYFAYGSKMNHSCLKNGEMFRLENFRLGFTRKSSENRRWKGSGVADIIPSKGDFCWGVVFKVDERDIKLMDEEEGTKYRSYERICLPNGMIAYTVPADKKQDFVQPSAEYLDEIIQGARKYGLPEEWIKHLESFRV